MEKPKVTTMAIAMQAQQQSTMMATMKRMMTQHQRAAIGKFEVRV